MVTNPYTLAQNQSYQNSENQWLSYLQGNPAPAAITSTTPGQYSSSLGAVRQPASPNYYHKVLNQPASDDVARLPDSTTQRFAGNWWNDIPQATFGDIINDPEKFTRMWAKDFNLGENTQRTVNQFAPMPVNYLYGMGLDDEMSGDFPMQKQAALQSQFFDRILTGGTNQGEGTGGRYIDPRQLMQTALNAVTVKDASGNYAGRQNPLAMQFGDPAVPPETQADNFIKYVASTVGNLVPQGHAQALINVYQREKELFSDYITSNPTVNVTFNKWIKDRLGPTGGL